MNKRIKAELHVEEMSYEPRPRERGDNGQRARIWIDVWMDDVKLFGHVVYSGRKDVADDIMGGRLFFNSNSQLVDAAGVEDTRT